MTNPAQGDRGAGMWGRKVLGTTKHCLEITVELLINNTVIFSVTVFYQAELQLKMLTHGGLHCLFTYLYLSKRYWLCIHASRCLLSRGATLSWCRCGFFLIDLHFSRGGLAILLYTKAAVGDAFFPLAVLFK